MAFKSKGKKNRGSQHATVKNLMEKTKMQRCLWIRQEPTPLLSEVIDKFPHLSTSRWVSFIKFQGNKLTLFSSFDESLGQLPHVRIVFLQWWKTG